mmetsp:Transcript_20997/g.49098  ORF Transcript_20997/g.49098 Transcript_20997/m.49098 type:complete len:262 (-) Transcript_20997:111-896(-)
MLAVVTGGNKGIGFEIVRAIAAAPGWRVILAARDISRGTEAVKSLGLPNVSFKQLAIDDEASIKRFAGEIQAEGGCINALVNNAARKGTDPAPSKQARPTMTVNYYATLNVTRALLPFVRAARGTIVTVCSQAGLLKALGARGPEFTSPSVTVEKISELVESFVRDAEAGIHSEQGWEHSSYGTSKAAVFAMLRVLARDEQAAGTGVTLNGCCPGFCDTDMTKHRGPRPASKGAETPAWLALGGAGGATGKFYYDKQELNW